jgi:signal transduction histidine kinase
VIRVQATSVGQALFRTGYLRSRWPLCAALYLLAGGINGMLTLLTALALFTVGGILAVVVVGLPLLAGLALIGVPTAGLERWSRRLVDSRPLRHAHRVPPSPGLASWLRTRCTEAGTWRSLGFAALLMTVLWPIDLLAVTLAVTVPAALLATPVLFATIGDADQVNVLKAYPVTSWPQALLSCAAGVIALAACAYGVGAVAAGRAALARAILAPPDTGRVDQDVVELVRSRMRLVDAFEAERSRIERDLHDGAQQRIVALSVMLGLARLDAPAGPLAEQLSRAHDEAGRALVELRELIRGIHPPLLTDFGLEAAVSDLATRSAVRIDVTFGVAERFSRAVESAAYFVVSEALANMAKHSGADRGEITGGYTDGTLSVAICDNGRGGADIRDGTGLIGLADRVSVVGGTLSLSSPPGGPTRLIVEIPCQALPDSA